MTCQDGFISLRISNNNHIVSLCLKSCWHRKLINITGIYKSYFQQYVNPNQITEIYRKLTVWLEGMTAIHPLTWLCHCTYWQFRTLCWCCQHYTAVHNTLPVTVWLVDQGFQSTVWRVAPQASVESFWPEPTKWTKVVSKSNHHWNLKF